jgi:hypothetical protein
MGRCGEIVAGVRILEHMRAPFVCNDHARGFVRPDG